MFMHTCVYILHVYIIYIYIYIYIYLFLPWSSWKWPVGRISDTVHYMFFWVFGANLHIFGSIWITFDHHRHLNISVHIWTWLIFRTYLVTLLRVDLNIRKEKGRWKTAASIDLPRGRHWYGAAVCHALRCSMLRPFAMCRKRWLLLLSLLVVIVFSTISIRIIWVFSSSCRPRSSPNSCSRSSSSSCSSCSSIRSSRRRCRRSSTSTTVDGRNPAPLSKAYTWNLALLI